MDNFSYILVNETNQIYTKLNSYDRKNSRFEGEYSLLHNTYSYDSFFLSRFLLAFKNQPLLLIDHQHELHKKALNQFQHFSEDDIPKYIEEKKFREIEQKKDQQMDKDLGQLQLSIVKGMIEKQLESVRNQSGSNPSEHQVLIGKELSLQWALHMIDDIAKQV